MARGQLPRQSSDLIVRLMLKLSTVVGPPALLSYPMFDEQVTGLLRSAEREGRMFLWTTSSRNGSPPCREASSVV